MELSWEKVSAQLQPATTGHARLVLSKTVPFFCTSQYLGTRKGNAHSGQSPYFPDWDWVSTFFGTFGTNSIGSAAADSFAYWRHFSQSADFSPSSQIADFTTFDSAFIGLLWLLRCQKEATLVRDDVICRREKAVIVGGGDKWPSKAVNDCPYLSNYSVQSQISRRWRCDDNRMCTRRPFFFLVQLYPWRNFTGFPPAILSMIGNFENWFSTKISYWLCSPRFCSKVKESLGRRRMGL